MSEAVAEPIRVGIDIGGTKTHAVALTSHGALRDEVIEPTTRGARGLLATIRRSVDELTHASGAPVSSLGIGIPGQVDVHCGVVRQALNLGIEQWEIVESVQASTGIRPRVDNDVNAAALGARELLSVSGSMAFLNLGTGVAAGIVVNGRLLRGAIGAAGEIGHLSIDPSGPRCECGQRGCIEAFASGPAIGRAIGADSRGAVVEMFDRAERGDLVAVDARRAFGRAVAAAVTSLLVTVDVERVVIGGGVAAVGSPAEQTITRALDDAARESPFIASLAATERVSYLPASLRAPAIGAALLGAEDLEWR